MFKLTVLCYLYGREKRKSRDFVAGNSRESELFEVGKKSLRLKVLHFAILRRGVIQVKIQLDDL